MVGHLIFQMSIVSHYTHEKDQDASFHDARNNNIPVNSRWQNARLRHTYFASGDKYTGEFKMT